MESLPEDIVCRILEAAAAGDDIKTFINACAVNKRLRACGQKCGFPKTLVIPWISRVSPPERCILWTVLFGRSLRCLEVIGTLLTLERLLECGFGHSREVMLPALEELTFRHVPAPVAEAAAVIELPDEVLRSFRFLSGTDDARFELKGGASLETLILDGGELVFEALAPALARMPALAKLRFSERVDRPSAVVITPEILPAIRDLALDLRSVVVSIPRGMPFLEALDLREYDFNGSIEVAPDFLRGSPALRVFTVGMGFSTVISAAASLAYGDSMLERVTIDTMDVDNGTVMLPRTARWVDLNMATMTDATFARRPRVEHLLMPDYNMGRPEMDGSVIEWPALRLVGVDIMQIPGVVPDVPVVPMDGPQLTLLVGLHGFDDHDFDERDCIAALEPIGALVKRVVVCCGPEAEAIGRFGRVNFGPGAFKTKSAMTRAIARACPGAAVVFRKNQLSKEYGSTDAA